MILVFGFLILDKNNFLGFCHVKTLTSTKFNNKHAYFVDKYIDRCKEVLRGNVDIVVKTAKQITSKRGQDLFQLFKQKVLKLKPDIDTRVLTNISIQLVSEYLVRYIRPCSVHLILVSFSTASKDFNSIKTVIFQLSKDIGLFLQGLLAKFQN